jgi:hypothetical protein
LLAIASVNAQVFLRGKGTTQYKAASTTSPTSERSAVRFFEFDDSRLETRASASFQKPIAVIRLHTI